MVHCNLPLEAGALDDMPEQSWSSITSRPSNFEKIAPALALDQVVIDKPLMRSWKPAALDHVKPKAGKDCGDRIFAVPTAADTPSSCPNQGHGQAALA